MLFNSRLSLKTALALGCVLISGEALGGSGCSKIQGSTPLLLEEEHDPIAIPQKVLTLEDMTHWARDYVGSKAFKKSEFYGIWRQRNKEATDAYVKGHKMDPNVHLYYLSNPSTREFPIISEVYTSVQRNAPKPWESFNSLRFYDIWTLPLGIVHAVNLRVLYLSNITLPHFPEGLPPLDQLTSLLLTAVFPQDVSFLRDLTRLETLKLCGNNFKELPPVPLNGALTTLMLEGNQFGEADLRPLSEIVARLENLTYLGLDNNGLETLPSLENLRRLSVLTLINNQLGAFPSLSPEAPLVTLSLSQNQIPAIPSLAHFTKLYMLRLAGNPLAAFPELPPTDTLNYIELFDTNIAKIPDEIGELKFLKSLALHETSIRTLPKALGQCERLVLLTLPYGPADYEHRKFPPLDGVFPVHIDHNNKVTNLLDVLNYLDRKADAKEEEGAE